MEDIARPVRLPIDDGRNVRGHGVARRGTDRLHLVGHRRAAVITHRASEAWRGLARSTRRPRKRPAPTSAQSYLRWPDPARAPYVLAMPIPERLTASLPDRLAEDLKHARRVAIRVLKPALGAGLGAERFIKEIRTAANLQHPNLLPLCDSGKADALLFYVTPYVEGETLRARLDAEQQSAGLVDRYRLELRPR